MNLQTTLIPSLPARMCVRFIRAYQRWISPHMFPCCRFTPSCSSYAIEAFVRHGFIRGCLLATGRILRCNPLCTGGNDPVPD